VPRPCLHPAAAKVTSTARRLPSLSRSPESTVPTTLHTAELPELSLLHRGTVRDVFSLPDNEILIVATDRLSAFDVVLPDPIPGKGEMLTRMSSFWFDQTAHLVPNHLSTTA
jgi:phosphoribosylaminoimidazole-succinocarboxamide synthase